MALDQCQKETKTSGCFSHLVAAILPSETALAPLTLQPVQKEHCFPPYPLHATWLQITTDTAIPIEPVKEAGGKERPREADEKEQYLLQTGVSVRVSVGKNALVLPATRVLQLQDLLPVLMIQRALAGAFILVQIYFKLNSQRNISSKKTPSSCSLNYSLNLVLEG